MPESVVPILDSVRRAVGDALTPEGLSAWWESPSKNPPFFGQAPFET